MDKQLMIEIMTKGTEQATRDISSVKEEVSNTSEASRQMVAMEDKRDKQLKRFSIDRMRESKLYQQANVSMNGTLDEMVTKSQSLYQNLFNVRNMTFTTLGGGLAYVAYQMKQLDRAGQQVNTGLDTMGIKLASTVKKSKGLSSYSEAQQASKSYIDWARKYASNTPFEQTEVISAMSNLAPVVKGKQDQVEKAVRVASVLSAVDPTQGFEGAVFAIREALSGSFTSLSARFELPKNLVSKYKTGGRDTLDAMLAGLESMGYTEDMVQRVSQTPDGMNSNISDSRNYIAGNFNKPIYDQRKRNLYDRMQSVQGYGVANGGQDMFMSALGQGAANGMQNMHMMQQGFMRPVNAGVQGLMGAFAPGLNHARSSMEKASLETEVEDYQSRIGTLTSIELERYKEVRMRLRQLPGEMAKFDRDATTTIKKSGSYIGKVLGLTTAETAALTKRLLDMSEKFKKFVDRAAASFQHGPIHNFIKFLMNAFTSAGKTFTEVFMGVQKSGALGELAKAGRELWKAFVELGSAVSKGLFESLGVSGVTLASGAKLIGEQLVKGIQAVTPLLVLLTRFATMMVKGITWAVEKIDVVIDKGAGFMEKGLRLIGRDDDADALAQWRTENTHDFTAQAQQQQGGGKGVTGTGGQPAGQAKPTERKDDHKAAIVGLAGVLGINLVGVAGMIGMATKTAEVWRDGQQTGGLWGGVKSLTRGFFSIGAGPAAARTSTMTGELAALDGAPGVGPGNRMGMLARLRSGFSMRNILTGRGAGGLTAGLALNTLMPGNPVTVLYNIISAVNAVKGTFGLISKLVKAYGRSVVSGFKTMFSGIMKIPASIKGFITNFGKLFGKIPNAAKAVSGWLGQMIKPISSMIGKIPIVGKQLLKTLGLEAAAGAVGAAVGAVLAPVDAAAVGWMGGRALGGLKRQDGTGRTVDQYQQEQFIDEAARNPAFAKLIGMNQKDAKTLAAENYKRNQAAIAKNNAKAATPKESADHTAAVLPLLLADSKTLAASKAFLNRLDGTIGGMGAGGGGNVGFPTGGAGGPPGAPGKFTGVVGKGVGGQKQAMFNKVLAAAKAAGDPHPEVTAAQWALESGWGAHQSGKNNYFGVKGQGTTKTTWEGSGVNRHQVSASFKDYGSLEESIADRVRFVGQNSRYAAYGKAGTSYDAMKALQQGGYAGTNAEYAQQLAGVLATAGIDPNASLAKAGVTAKGGAGGTNLSVGGVTVNGQNPVDALISAHAGQQTAAKQLIAQGGGKKT